MVLQMRVYPRQGYTLDIATRSVGDYYECMLMVDPKPGKRGCSTPVGRHLHILRALVIVA